MHFYITELVPYITFCKHGKEKDVTTNFSTKALSLWINLPFVPDQKTF